MKKFNINYYMYIQITDDGWLHLKNTVGENYIKSRKETINGEDWYKMQCWDAFHLMPVKLGGQPLFKTNVMFNEGDLE